MLYQLIALCGSFLLSFLLTPVFRRVAIRFGLVDHPDTHRKLHREPIALCGGPTILICSMLAAFAMPLFSPTLREKFWLEPWPLIGLVSGAIAIVILGMIDDRFTLRGRQKLFGQIAICSWLVWTGYQMGSVEMFGFHLDLAVLMVPASVFWLLMTVNSLNLIDGADGLCSSVGWIASAGIAALAAIAGHELEASVASGLAGALLGFLVYNFPPAKVFLGDSGSMLVGLVLGALAIRATLKGPATVSLLAPVAIFAIPFFDSCMAILRRKLTGRSIFSTDRGHIHHSMLRWGLSNRGLVLAINLLCAVTAAGALLSSLFSRPLFAVVSTACVLGCLVISRAFGHAELQLLVNRVYHFGGSLVPQLHKSELPGNCHAIRFQGNRAWETVWDALIEFADKHKLSKVSLDLNIPWLHEGFHASWNRCRVPDEAHAWKSQVPIFAGPRSLGRMVLVGRMEDVNSLYLLGELSEMLEGLQPVLVALASEVAAASTVVDPIENEPAAINLSEDTMQFSGDDSVEFHIPIDLLHDSMESKVEVV